LRERVWLAQRIALARFLGIKWADIARLEGMSERTLRYHVARWRKELEQEQEPVSDLLRACGLMVEADTHPNAWTRLQVGADRAGGDRAGGDHVRVRGSGRVR
jgi:hypothetical protein